MKVAILGSGEWGRALATLTAEAGNQPMIGYRGQPPGGFPGSPNFASLVMEAELVLVSVPPAAVRTVIRQARPGPGIKVVIASRGLEPETGGWLSETVTAESSCQQVGALAGPALAAEVMRRNPSALVVASPFEAVCTITQEALHSSICRIYTSPDLQGVELAGAMVRLLATAIGIADGLGVGFGVRGLVVTRGIAETTRLGNALGADATTFAGLAGIGDLVSCASQRDHPSHAAGIALARGRNRDEALIHEAQAVLALANRHSVDLPLTRAIAAIADGKVSPRLALDQLMRRDARAE